VERVFLHLTRRVGLNLSVRSVGLDGPKRCTGQQHSRFVNNCSVQVMDEARFLDDFRVRALANDGGLLTAHPASASVPRTTIEAPNSPSPALC
jgi:hypothetical protein